MVLAVSKLKCLLSVNHTTEIVQHQFIIITIINRNQPLTIYCLFATLEESNFNNQKLTILFFFLP